MCATPNKRPRRCTPDMVMGGALAVARDLIKAGSFDKKDTPEDLAADIAKACQGNQHIDGYKLAKALENLCGWEPDAAMVEYLDGFSYRCITLLDAAEKQWGVENPMEPPLAIGAVVRVSDGMGVIDHINKYKPAYYAVRVARLDDGFELIRFEDAVEVLAA